jgi:hypothetical protein
MYNPQYVINKPLGNKQITYPTMLYNSKEVPIKLVRLTQAMPMRDFIRFRNSAFDVMGSSVYWTNDNVDDILLNLSKPLTKEIYTIVEYSMSSPQKINPFESDINCEKKDTTDFDYYNFYNCHPYKYVYLLEFRDNNKTNIFLRKYVDINYILPVFEEYNPYEFIFYITILGRRMNFFNMKVSTTLLYYICDKLIENFKPIIKEAFTRFSEKTLNIIQGPYTIINPNHLTDYLYSEKQPRLFYNMLGDSNYIWFGFINHTDKRFKKSDVKIQMCIKEEYIYWVVNKLLINLDKVISNNIFAFKFFIHDDKYLASYAFKFPSFETNFVDERFEKYIFEGKEYKREIKTSPNLVFYLSNDVNVKDVIDALYELFPDTEKLNYKKISNGFIPRHNFRLTQNICISIGGDNQYKNDYSKLNETYIDENIPIEYKEIIDIANTYVLTEEQCDLFNEYTNTISGHDLLTYENGECGINNILSYKGIINNKRSFNNVFQELNLLDYYEQFYNNPNFILFKKNIKEKSPLKPLSAGYKLKTNKKISKRLTNKRKKRTSKN